MRTVLRKIRQNDALAALAFFSLLICSVLASPAFSADHQDGTAVPRKIYMFYNPDVARLKEQPGHLLAAMPLNFLGMDIVYVPSTAPLPDIANDPEVRGIVTWFENGWMENPRAWIQWTNKLLDKGKKVVIIGDMGFRTGRDGRPNISIGEINNMLARLGFRTDEGWSDTTFDSRIIKREPGFYDYERQMTARLPAYELYRPTRPDVHSFLVVQRGRKGPKSHLAMTSKNGGFIEIGWAYYKDPVYFKTQWYMNPFHFFREALRTDDLPKPDTTTLSGRRMYYSHIDGDGWRNVSLADKYRKAQTYSAEVVLKEAIEAYPDLPITVGPIAADLDPAWSGDEDAQDIARRLFLLPQVELAHHTFSHPFEWEFFEDYADAKEYPFLRLYNIHKAEDWGVESISDAADAKPVYSLKAAYDQPRGFGSFPFELKKEFGGAAEVVNQFAPPGKKVEIVLWSGNTSPTENMLKASREAGLLNLNGGDMRFDPEFPSVSFVPPVGIRVGSQLQIYASASNENTYTDLWTSRYFGFQDLIHSLKNTESPRRLKPINVYYHMYSGERQSALNALLTNLNYSRTQQIAPVKTTHYAQIAEGFYTVRFRLLGPETWRVDTRGRLQTVRFDDDGKKVVNYARSEGVIGHRRFQGSLYVALDESVETPVIALGDTKTTAPAPHPYLDNARWHVWDVQHRDGGLTFSADGFGHGEMVWRNMTDGAYRIVLTRPGEPDLETRATTTKGVLNTTIPVNIFAPVKVRILRMRNG